MANDYNIATLAERFARYWIPEPNSGCWLWTGALAKGRAFMNSGHKGKAVHAARISWFLHKGDFQSLYVLHHCDNAACVNPDHLYLGTQTQNVADGVRRGRYANNGRNQRQKTRPRKPYCANGHEFTPENTRWATGRKSLVRHCRACCRINCKSYRQRQRA